jgi:hypothetical protein
MSKRIGEHLIEKGLITPLQLDRALKAQLIFGGHLGTSLIELGFVTEETLGATLAKIHRVRHATPDMLLQISPDVLDILPVEAVERYRVVPLKIEPKKKRLHLAVIEPKSMPPISSVRRFNTIVPWVVPEIRILQAMEEHYGIPRRPRYINICHELERSTDTAAKPEGGVAPDTTDGTHPAQEAVPSNRHESAVPDAASTADIGVEYGYGKSWRDVARNLFDDDGDEAPEGTARKSARQEPDQPETARSSGLRETAAKLSRAANKYDLAKAALDHVDHTTSGSILFGVKNDTAHIWDWRGFGFSPEHVRGLKFPVTSGSIFTLLLGNEHYIGPVPDDVGTRWIFGALQIEVPREVLLLPVYLNDRLVAILYGDGGPEGRVEGEVDEYLHLIHKLSMAMNMLILKMKIRAA